MNVSRSQWESLYNMWTQKSPGHSSLLVSILFDECGV